MFPFLTILPPLIILLCGFYNRNVLFALISGILVAAFLATHYSVVGMFTLTTLRFWLNISDFYNLCICLFLAMLGIFVTLMRCTGATFAYSSIIKKKLKTTRATEMASLILSHLLCIDDYFSSLMVGSVMQSLTDRYNIPRAKLAFLVDSMAAPLTIIIPFSSWVAALVSFLKESGIDTIQNQSTLLLINPFSVYLHIIPFTFYSFIAVASTWFIVGNRISFGKMYDYEMALQSQDAPYTYERNDNHTRQATMLDFIVPIGTLLASIIGSLLYTGGFSFFDGRISVINALQNAHAATALLYAGMLMLSTSFTFFYLRKRILVHHIKPIMRKGFFLMLPSISIIVCAWTFGNIVREDLHTGEQIAHLFTTLHFPLQFLPFIFFLVSALMAFSIGSSWATLAIMFPLAVPLVLSLSNTLHILYISLGAILSGAACGDHASPVSDTTIMSAGSSGAQHIEHVETQLPYALTFATGTSLAFLVAGFLIDYGFVITFTASLTTGVVSSCLIAYFCNRKRNV